MPKKIFLATNISELLSNQIPIKYKDLDCPIISCIIGQTVINCAPGLDKLSPTKVIVQLANWSVKIPKGEITNVLIRVGEFIYPVDFIVLETQPVSNPKSQTPASVLYDCKCDHQL